MARSACLSAWGQIVICDPGECMRTLVTETKADGE